MLMCYPKHRRKSSSMLFFPRFSHLHFPYSVKHQHPQGTVQMSLSQKRIHSILRMTNKLEADLLKVKYKKLIQVQKQDIIQQARSSMVNQYGNRVFNNQPISYKYISDQEKEEVIRDRMYTPYIQNSRLNNLKITNLNNGFPKSQERARSCSDKDFVLLREKATPVNLPSSKYFNQPEIIPDYYRRPLAMQYRELNRLRKKPDTALHGSKLDIEEVVGHQYNDVNKKINSMFRSQLQMSQKQNYEKINEMFIETQPISIQDNSQYQSIEISKDFKTSLSNTQNSSQLSQ